MQPVIEQWLEKQKSPDSVIASKIASGKVERTRPLCPYPQVAAWKGTGSIDESAGPQAFSADFGAEWQFPRRTW